MEIIPHKESIEARIIPLQSILNAIQSTTSDDQLSVADVSHFIQQALDLGHLMDIPFGPPLNREEITWDLTEAPRMHRGQLLRAWIAPAMARIALLMQGLETAPWPCLDHIDGGVERIAGHTNRHQIWVLAPDGTEIIPQISVPNGRRTHEMHREWFFLSTACVVVEHTKDTTAAPHECTWIYRPPVVTSAQAAALQRIAERLDAQWPTSGEGNWLGRLSPHCPGWIV
jgi:hypothetical protein